MFANIWPQSEIYAARHCNSQIALKATELLILNVLNSQREDYSADFCEQAGHRKDKSELAEFRRLSSFSQIC